MITEKVLLSQCGNLLVLDDSEKDRYQIEIDSGDFLLIEIGASVKKAGSRFTHPNIVQSVKRLYEFKHYRNNGSKFWTRQAGISHYVIIPKNLIYILPEKGYSYIKAEINGVKVTFNVSGGTRNGWTDWLGNRTSILVNHKLSDIKKLVEVAIRNPDLEKDIDFSKMVMEERQAEQWEEMFILASPKLQKQRNTFYTMIDEGKTPAVYLKRGYEASTGVATKLYRRMEKVWLNTEKTKWTYEETGTVKYIYGKLDTEYREYRIRLSQIDWVKTLKDIVPQKKSKKVLTLPDNYVTVPA